MIKCDQFVLMSKNHEPFKVFNANINDTENHNNFMNFDHK